MRSLVCSPRAQSFGSGCHVNCRGERSAPGANKTCLPEKTFEAGTLSYSVRLAY